MNRPASFPLIAFHFHQGLKPTKTVDGTYRVRSVSKPGTFHTVVLDDAGRILRCSQCKGWEQGKGPGRQCITKCRR